MIRAMYFRNWDIRVQYLTTQVYFLTGFDMDCASPEEIVEGKRIVNSYFNGDSLSETDMESYFYRELNAAVPRDLPCFQDPSKREEMRTICIERMDSILVSFVLGCDLQESLTNDTTVVHPSTLLPPSSSPDKTVSEDSPIEQTRIQETNKGKNARTTQPEDRIAARTRILRELKESTMYRRQSVRQMRALFGEYCIWLCIGERKGDAFPHVYIKHCDVFKWLFLCSLGALLS